jgi:hypothetical protein
MDVPAMVAVEGMSMSRLADLGIAKRLSLIVASLPAGAIEEQTATTGETSRRPRRNCAAWCRRSRSDRTHPDCTGRGTRFTPPLPDSSAQDENNSSWR